MPHSNESQCAICGLIRPGPSHMLEHAVATKVERARPPSPLHAELVAERDALRKQVESLQGLLDAANLHGPAAQMRLLRSELKDLKSANAELERKLRAEREKRVAAQEPSHDVDKLKTMLADRDASLANMNARYVQAVEAGRAAQAKLDEQTQAHKHAVNNCLELHAQLATLRSSCARENEEACAARAANLRLKDEIKNLSVTAAQLRYDDTRALERAKNNLQAELDKNAALHSANETLKRELKEMTINCDKLRDLANSDRAKSKEQFQQLSADRKTVVAERDRARQDAEEQRQRAHAAFVQINQLRAQCDNYRTITARLQKSVDEHSNWIGIKRSRDAAFELLAEVRETSRQCVGRIGRFLDAQPSRDPNVVLASRKAVITVATKVTRSTVRRTDHAALQQSLDDPGAQVVMHGDDNEEEYASQQSDSDNDQSDSDTFSSTISQRSHQRRARDRPFRHVFDDEPRRYDRRRGSARRRHAPQRLSYGPDGQVEREQRVVSRRARRFWSETVRRRNRHSDLENESSASAASGSTSADEDEME